MTDRRPRLSSPLRQTIAVATTAIVILGALVVQYARHAWPFPQQECIAADGEHLDHEAPPSSQRATTAPEVPPRAAIPFDAGRFAPMGITVARVERGPIETELRAVAAIVPDEALVSHPHTRVSGWIERLYVRTTGQRVRAGAPLVLIFSQELLASQDEYLAALRASARGGSSVVVRSARERLRVLGMTGAEIRALSRRGEARRNVVIVAPRDGVVLHRGVTVGTAVDPSTELFTVADLSRVWAIAEIPQSRVPDVHVGTPAQIDLAGDAALRLESRVDFVYPTLSERTRTLRVRFVLPNPDGELRPGMFGSATLSFAPRETLLIPRDAIVDTGLHQHVFVIGDDGMATPRTVKLGTWLGDRVEVLGGLVEGETIVASGVFLIDSESRLRASGGAGAHAHAAAEAPAQAREPGASATTEPGHRGH